MSRLSRWLAPTTVVRAHCDLPCGVYDPEQAGLAAVLKRLEKPKPDVPVTTDAVPVAAAAISK